MIKKYGFLFLKGMAMGAAALRAQSMAAANFAAKGAQKAVRIVPFVGD